jgi:hypothetical protein
MKCKRGLVFCPLHGIKAIAVKRFLSQIVSTYKRPLFKLHKHNFFFLKKQRLSLIFENGTSPSNCVKEENQTPTVALVTRHQCFYLE